MPFPRRPLTCSTPQVAKVFRVAMWIFSEYCLSEDEIEGAVRTMRNSLGSLPFVDEELVKKADTSAQVTVAKKAPSVLADGTYASQSSAGMTATSLVKKDDLPSLRTMLLSGDYFLASMTASSLTKLVLRLAGTKGVSGSKVNALVAEAMQFVCGMVRLGKSGITSTKMDDDCHERMWLCLLVLSDPYNENMCEIWTQKCRQSYATLLVQKQKTISQAAEEEGGKNKIKSHADDLLTFRQLRGKGVVVTEIEDEDALVRGVLLWHAQQDGVICSMVSCS